MKAIVVDAFGEPEVMQLRDVALPEPRAGEVRVRVAAAGVNYADINQRSGAGRAPIPLPFTPGLEGAGTVDDIGDDVAGVEPGARVAYDGVRGSYAEFAIVPRDKLIVLPGAVSFEQGAALLSQGLIAHVLASDVLPLREGMTAVVHSAAGGVGVLLVQLLKARGVFVIGTASSDEKRGIAIDYGADVAVSYDEFVEEAYHATSGHGVDVVFDAVGKPTLPAAFDAVRTRGTVVVYGRAGGDPDAIVPTSLIGRSISLIGVNSADHVATRGELERRSAALLDAVTSGALHVLIDFAFPLAAAADAHRRLAARESSGKLLLVP